MAAQGAGHAAMLFLESPCMNFWCLLDYESEKWGLWVCPLRQTRPLRSNGTSALKCKHKKITLQITSVGVLKCFNQSYLHFT